MSFFSTDGDGVAQVPRSQLAARQRSATVRNRGWAALSIAFIALLGMSLIPSPYAIQMPGPVRDTLGTSSIDGAETPLIEVSGTETYPTSGTLDLLTVSVHGQPDSRPSWLAIAASWFNPSHVIVPIDSVYAPEQTAEERDAQNAALMTNSQHEAVAAALKHQQINFDSTLTIISVEDGQGAAGIIEAGDIIDSINGIQAVTVDDIREQLAIVGAGNPVTLVVTRDGEQRELIITPQLNEQGVSAAGIAVSADYLFPFDVTIQIENIGGPSAGMMFALGLIDKITTGELTGGLSVAGTGSITAGGVVGEIGGIRQKLYGAATAGADIFLAPADNCSETVGHVPEGLEVFRVTTLADAVHILETLATGTDSDTLPRCEVG